jgi:cytoskeletal protein CcmA (bactofilin family)
MFEINKKGADKAPESSSQRLDSPAARTDSSTAPRREAQREAAVIGPSIHIDGDLRGEEDLLIEGEVNGTVQLKNNSLTIGPQGKIRADVYAHSIYVDGFMEGDLYGSERVNIRKTAQVRGNVTSPRVNLEDGAKFKGSIEMDPQAVQGALGAGRGAAKGPAPAQQQQPPRPPTKDSLSPPAKPETNTNTNVPGAAAAKSG